MRHPDWKGFGQHFDLTQWNRHWSERKYSSIQKCVLLVALERLTFPQAGSHFALFTAPITNASLRGTLGPITCSSRSSRRCLEAIFACSSSGATKVTCAIVDSGNHTEVL